MEVDVPLGPWLPDQPNFRNPGCVVAENVLPTPGGYGPIPGWAGVGVSTTNDVSGAAQVFDNSGASVLVGGGGTRLFTVRGTTLAETTGLSAAVAWDFARFNDFVFATDVNNAPQYLTDIDTDDTWSSVPGSPPQAKYCATINNFLFLGNIDGAPYRIQWSPYNNPAGTWGTDRLTQAGLADLATEFGGVQRIIGGRFGLIFQERGIQSIVYVGAPVVWDVQVLSKDRGTPAPWSVVNVGHTVYFLAQDGFFATDGSTPVPIGGSRINTWFFDTAAPASISGVQGAVDWENQCVLWAFQSRESEVRDYLLIYSWQEQRWSYAKLSTHWLVPTVTAGVTLEGLDALYPSGLESVPYSLDSSQFVGASRKLAAFVDGSTGSDLGTFTGPPMAAAWETTEIQPVPGRRVFIHGVRPVARFQDPDFSAQIAMQDGFGVERVGQPRPMGFGGFCPASGEGNTVRIRLTKPGSGAWSDAQGVQLQFRVAGSR